LHENVPVKVGESHITPLSAAEKEELGRAFSHDKVGTVSASINWLVPACNFFGLDGNVCVTRA
jgi:hypothetical protein